MEIDSLENSNWLLDYTLMEDISVPVSNFPAPISTSVHGFDWPSQPFNGSSTISVEVDCSIGDPDGFKEVGSRKRVEVDCSIGDPDGFKEVGSRKRLKAESCNASGSKACREKLRRDKLNERFLELGSTLEPGRPPRTDKVALLSDAGRMVTQLRDEAQKLKESNEDLQEKIKELKAEKNELRDEKQRLKADKEKLEEQVKALSTPRPGFLPHPSQISAAFAAQGQAAFAAQGEAAGSKLMPFIGYPGVAMWQFMSPAAVDTSKDHILRPPVA